MMVPHSVLPTGYRMWLVVLVLADVGLAVASKIRNKVLVLPWLIVYMITIIVIWIVTPLIILISDVIMHNLRFVGSCFIPNESESLPCRKNAETETLELLNRNLPNDRDLEEETINKISQFDHIDALKNEEHRPLLGLIIFGFCLSIWYLYIWVASRSLYYELENPQQQNKIAPGNQSTNKRVVAWSTNATSSMVSIIVKHIPVHRLFKILFSHL